MTAAYVFFTGASTIMVLGQILAIPKSLYEAAEIDGISNFKVDWYITLPMIKDTIKTISVMAASAGFLIYNEVFFLTNGAAGTKSISFIIRELAVSSSRTQYARANTVGVFQILGGLLIIVLIGLIFRNKDNKLMK
ncbi:sugar ABC transporter permease [Phocoenobacter atlanticus subsp. cyclopteri]|nr:sugar ABC transporter permease [Pasteurella atlantica]